MQTQDLRLKTTSLKTKAWHMEYLAGSDRDRRKREKERVRSWAAYALGEIQRHAPDKTVKECHTV